VPLFAQGIVLRDGYQCKSAQLQVVTSGFRSEIRLTIREGKNRQVRRMFEALDMKVLHLKRIAFGGVPLDEALAEGECRMLSEDEVRTIRNAGVSQ